MTLIAAKRAQQALFEMASSMNRLQGSAGGSGLNPLHLVGSSVSSPTIVGITYSELASVPLNAPYSARFLFFASLAFTIQDTVADSEIITLTLDGNAAPNFGAPDFSPYCQAQSPIGTTNMPTQSVMWTTGVDPSPHRVSLMLGKTGGTISQVWYTLYAFQVS